MSHYDKDYFDRLEARRAQQASIRRQRREADRDHPWYLTVLLIALFFLVLVGIVYLPTVLSGMRPF